MTHSKLPSNITSITIQLKEAIKERDALTVGRIVAYFRFELRMNYEDCYEVAAKCSDISLEDWDELLYEADHIDS